MAYQCNSARITIVEVALIFLLLAYFIFFTVNHVNQTAGALCLGSADSGQFNQYLWNLTHGHAPTTTIKPEVASPESVHIFRKHLYLTFFLLSPLYALYSSYKTLIIVNTLFVIVAGSLLFIFARRLSQSSLIGLLLSLSFLFTPIIWESFRWGFHPLTMSLPFFFMACYALETNRRFIYFMGIILAIGCKESIAVYVLFLGIYACLRKDIPGKNSVGLLTIVICLLYLALSIGLIIPMHSETKSYLSFPSAKVAPLLQQDHAILKFQASKFVKSILPVSIFPFLTAAAILVIPGLLQILLYRSAESVWYDIPSVMCMYAAAVWGLKIITQKFPKYRPLVVTFLFIGLGFNLYSMRKIKVYPPSRLEKLIESVKGRYIRPENSVLTQPMLLPLFCDRNIVYGLDCAYPCQASDFEALGAEYVIFSLTRPGSLYEIPELISIIRFVKHTTKYTIKSIDYGFVILNKAGQNGISDRGYRNIAIKCLQNTLKSYIQLYGPIARQEPRLAETFSFYEHLRTIEDDNLLDVATSLPID